MTHENDQVPTDIDPLADARVTNALDALGTVEPSPEFVGQVMWRTRHQAVRDNNQRRSARRVGQGVVMAKKVLVGLAAVAAVGLAVVYIGGFPAPSNTEGTIGAAQRYQAEQIKKSDVKVGDADLQAFLQTDIFDKLAHDKQAIAALANPAVQQALNSPEMRQALASPALRDALASPAVQQAIASPEIAQALAAPSVQQALSSPAFQQALSASGVQAALASPAFQAALASPALRDALASPAFQQAMLSPAFQQAMLSPALQGALASPAFQQAMASPAFQAALAGPALQAALASPAFQQGLAASGFVQQLSLQAQGLAASGAAGER
jgi:hypothetical protein